MPADSPMRRVAHPIRCTWSIGQFVAGAFVAILTAAWLVSLVQDLWHQHRAATRFVPVEGTVIAAEVKPSSLGTRHRARIIYRYDWQGTSYDSQRLDFSDTVHGGKGTGGRERAERFIARHPVGSKVIAYVDPSSGEISVLRVGLAGTDVMPILIVLALGGLAVMLIGKGVVGWLRHRDDVRADRLVESAEDVTFRMPSPSVWTLAAGVVTVTSYGGAELLYWATSRNPSVSAVLMLAAACVTLGAGMWWAAWRYRRDGCDSLSIDRRRGVLVLPPQSVRQASATWLPAARCR